jgi:hypothetical protein
LYSNLKQFRILLMSTIFGFGDSYTEGQPNDVTFPPFLEWKKLRGGNFPKCWIDLLAEMLRMEVKNFGRGGNSNQQIFDDICKNSHLFNKNDIVIVNWTYKHRFRWSALEFHSNGEPVYFDEDKKPRPVFRRLSINNDDPNDFNYITKSTKNEITKNRMSRVYTEEIYNYENLLEQFAKSKEFDLYFWSADDDIINHLSFEKRNVKKYICADKIDNKIKNLELHLSGKLMSHIKKMGGKTIIEETNGLVQDNHHFGELGHKVQSELFYEHILKYKSN